MDSKLGLLELRTSEGGRGSTVLFRGLGAGQVRTEKSIIKDIIFLSLSRQGYPNGAPKLLAECDQGLELAQLFPLGPL